MHTHPLGYCHVLSCHVLTSLALYAVLNLELV